MSRLYIRNPVAHRFADGVLQGPAAIGNADDVRSEETHPKDIQPLAPHVFLAHIDDAFHAHQRAHGCRGHSVLARAGFGYDSLFAHAPGQAESGPGSC